MAPSELPTFDRAKPGGGASLTRLGRQAVGGKATGLARAATMLAGETAAPATRPMRIDVPRLTVLAVDLFDAFVRHNRLERLLGDPPPDDRIARSFLAGELPVEWLGDLRALLVGFGGPLAVRSSSLLEDALQRPFAGVYATKMIPNNQSSPDERFRRFGEAIKLVWASTWFAGARAYLETVGDCREKMAVVVQEVVGVSHAERFYPDVSGVARTFNAYAVGGARPEDGVVNLALGLGKTIVDGGASWIYSPARPQAPPPVAGPAELLQRSQRRFWAVNTGRPPAWDPTRETEYLVHCELESAWYDGTLARLVSTYDAGRDRMVPGAGVDGPRALTFAPLLALGESELNRTVRTVLDVAEEAFGGPVEVEFAVTYPAPGRGGEPRFAVVQVRPMAVIGETVAVADEELVADDVLVASDLAMGNGTWTEIHDVVFVDPDVFDAAKTPLIASELSPIDRRLRSEQRPYLLIGFGRWGSSDPWLGIPVEWSAIAGAAVLVEATLGTMDVEPSQGAHFFHNMTGFGVGYLAARHDRGRGIDWRWLRGQTIIERTDFVTWVRTAAPLRIAIDGRNRRGVVKRPGGPGA